ncbi:hypothetical protein GCM10023169_32640 [Georgenia halophila]|uniref:histidine kinase n=1 Tax=Georgenia halophila TaxID=620889 RepID=A0ABP8LHM5_9MICO
MTEAQHGGRERPPPGAVRREWPVEVLLAGALAVVLLPSSLATAPGTNGAWWPVTTAALVVAHLSVLLRRHPAGLALCSAAMAVLVAVPGLGPVSSETGSFGPFPAILLPSSLVFLVVLYSVAAHAPRPWPTVGLVLGLSGAVLTAVRLWFSPVWPAPGLGGFDPTTLVARSAVLGVLAALVLAAWALGRYRSVRVAYLAQLEDRAVRAEADRERHAARVAAEERTRIAREMHDVVAHALAVIVRQAEGGRLAGEREPAVALSTLDTVARTGREALDDTRSVLGRLRGDGADGEAQRGAEDVPVLVAGVEEAGLPVHLEIAGTPAGLSRTASLAVYRVVQESLTNVVKHAGTGARAEVRIAYARGGADVAVRDFGGAAEDVSSTGAAGHGLLGMRERVTLEGGNLATGPADDGQPGFVVRASIPSGADRRRRNEQEDDS